MRSEETKDDDSPRLQGGPPFQVIEASVTCEGYCSGLTSPWIPGWVAGSIFGFLRSHPQKALYNII